MSIHTRLVGAFEGIILSVTAATNVVVLATLIDPSLGLTEMMGSRRGTVTIQQLASEDTTIVRHV